MTDRVTEPLGIDLGEVVRSLGRSRNLVLQAPPGAGKTTRVPLALLEAEWLTGKRIVMLEPRRLATRAAARRMASQLGDSVGGIVGHRMRLDTKVGPKTRIEVVTDGILIRMLQDDPGLQGIGIVIFDEFHERGLDSDLGLALTLETQRHLRDELRILVMSATLDGERVAALMGDAPVLSAEGKQFPVETRYLDPGRTERFEPMVASAIRRALTEESGSILVFLPGAGEIRRVQSLLEEAGLGSDVHIAPLYGELAQAEQDAALLPAAAGSRKIVLATAIAETSLTIEGIRVVVDGGLMRVPRFDPVSGMTRLATVRVSQASADQRRGRAGRLEPGVCYRLWPEAEHRALARYNTPEILAADLAPLALELASWGATAPSELAWLDPPPEAAYRQALDLLRRLTALDSIGHVTPHGNAIERLGLHPRLAHMILRGIERGAGSLACDIAAILSARDIVRPKSGPTARDADLRLRLDLIADSVESKDFASYSVDRRLLRQARQQSAELRRRAKVAAGTGDRSASGIILAEAYPDRIAQRRSGGDGQFLLSNGRGAALPLTDPMAAEDYLAVADLDGDKREARIFLAVPISRQEIEGEFADRLEVRDLVAWDSREKAVLARRQLRFGELVLRDERLAAPEGQQVIAALLVGIRQAGIAVLPWTREIDNWRARVTFMRQVQGPAAGWPDLSDDALLRDLDDWLAPLLGGVKRLAELSQIDLGSALRSRLDWEQQQRLEKLAPTHIVVPSGSRLPIEYGPDGPVLSVRVQEMFGSDATPTVAGGAIKIRLQLLSPAGRPMQVTSDLAGFWSTSYRSVRSEMRGRYPKHPWPEDPRTAEPTNRAKRRPA